jgi:hypothetical protein
MVERLRLDYLRRVSQLQELVQMIQASNGGSIPGRSCATEFAATGGKLAQHINCAFYGVAQRVVVPGVAPIAIMIASAKMIK